MNISIIVILCPIIVITIYCVIIFNNFIALKNNVKKNWSNIEVLLKQRNSELPKLIEICKQYMGYEQETLEKVIQARSAMITAQENQNIPALDKAETTMRLEVGKLFALAENYPPLKANETFQQLQNRISNLENSISDRREFYNESVTLNNIRIEQIPDVIIAKMFNFKFFDLLEISKNETEDVSVAKLFKK